VQTCDPVQAIVDAVLHQLTPETLARDIGLAIDEARDACMQSSAIAGSVEEVHDAVAAFYLTLLRHTSHLPAAIAPRDVADEAVSLLERAFSDRGGSAAAEVEALHPTVGGMRTVLNRMTDQYKAEQQEKRITRVLKEAFDPLDARTRTVATALLVRRMGAALPEDIRTGDPARFADKLELIAKAYMRMVQQLAPLLRSLR
jgi:hypothetical protein